MFAKIINNLRKNKYLYIILCIVFICLVYCSLNTFIINDDLGYSFFYRTSTRVTNIIQIIKNQISDYKIINSRIFIHSIVQFLLMFGKNLWSILNPISIILNFYFINKIVKLYVKKDNTILNFIIGIVCFLLIVDFKWMIYWVSGSLNYVWTSTILFAYIYFYLKYDLCEKIKLNMIFFLVISILHESLFVFMTILLIISILYDVIIGRKFYKQKLLLFIPLIISGIFLFLGPGMLYRMTSNTEWSKLSLFEKIGLSVPVISKNIYNLKNINNIIPIIFIIICSIKIFKTKDNKKYILLLLKLITIILICFLDNGWLYFVLSLLLLFEVFYLNYIDKRNNLSLIFLSFYAISYSMCLTIEYISGRPNYFMFICMISLSIIYLYDIVNQKYFNKAIILFIIFLFLLLFKEVFVYNKIGEVKRERLITIQEYKKENKEILYLKKLDSKYSLYQIDPNEPVNKNYYAYRLFLDYYGLDSNTKIKFVE